MENAQNFAAIISSMVLGPSFFRTFFQVFPFFMFSMFQITIFQCFPFFGVGEGDVLPKYGVGRCFPIFGDGVGGVCWPILGLGGWGWGFWGWGGVSPL